MKCCKVRNAKVTSLCSLLKFVYTSDSRNSRGKNTVYPRWMVKPKPAHCCSLRYLFKLFPCFLITSFLHHHDNDIYHTVGCVGRSSLPTAEPNVNVDSLFLLSVGQPIITGLMHANEAGISSKEAQLDRFKTSK